MKTPLHSQKAGAVTARSGSLQRMVRRLGELVETWKSRSRCKFRSAERAPNEIEKSHIEHGATCYFNCSEELQRLVDELGVSHTRSVSKGRKKPQA